MTMPEAIMTALGEGYGLSFKYSIDPTGDASVLMTYTVTCKDGCGYGRGHKFSGLEDFNPNASDILLDSLLATLKKIPEWEAAKVEHGTPVGTGAFAR